MQITPLTRADIAPLRLQIEDLAARIDRLILAHESKLETELQILLAEESR